MEEPALKPIANIPGVEHKEDGELAGDVLNMEEPTLKTRAERLKELEKEYEKEGKLAGKAFIDSFVKEWQTIIADLEKENEKKKEKDPTKADATLDDKIPSTGYWSETFLDSERELDPRRKFNRPIKISSRAIQYARAYINNEIGRIKEIVEDRECHFDTTRVVVFQRKPTPEPYTETETKE